MDIKTFFGLPAHPLLVHIPIVLIPLCGLGAIAMAFSLRLRDRFGIVVAGLTVVAGISTQLAVGSGQALRDSVPNSAALREHIRIAESVRPLVLVLFLAIVAQLWLDRRSRMTTAATLGAGPAPDGGERPVAGPSARSRSQLALGALAVVLALATNARLFQIGHSGAKATWSKVKIVQESGEHDGGG